MYVVSLFQPFWFYRADKQTDRQTEPVASHTDVDDRFAHATTVDVITETAAVFLLLAVHLTGGLFLSTNNILRVELQKFV